MASFNKDNGADVLPCPEPVDPRVGYDRAASAYDTWHWQSFWEKNETPAFEKLLRSLPNARVLDAGTGTGRYFRLIRSLGHEAYGFDVSPNMLAIAAEKSGYDGNLEPFLRIGDLRGIPFANRSFDCVFCCRVLSHVEELPRALAQLFRVLKRGGLAIIADVDGRHRYNATRIPVRGENVWIRTYKHLLEEVAHEGQHIGFKVIERQLIRASDLIWHPPASDFPAIDWTGNRPLSYRLILQRSE